MKRKSNTPTDYYASTAPKMRRVLRGMEEGKGKGRVIGSSNRGGRGRGGRGRGDIRTGLGTGEDELPLWVLSRAEEGEGKMCTILPKSSIVNNNWELGVISPQACGSGRSSSLIYFE